MQITRTSSCQHELSTIHRALNCFVLPTLLLLLLLLVVLVLVLALVLVPVAASGARSMREEAVNQVQRLRRLRGRAKPDYRIDLQSRWTARFTERLSIIQKSDAKVAAQEHSGSASENCSRVRRISRCVIPPRGIAALRRAFPTRYVYCGFIITREFETRRNGRGESSTKRIARLNA